MTKRLKTLQRIVDGGLVPVVRAESAEKALRLIDALLAGGVIVEDFAQIGMGATVNLNLTIGQAARVGNGATVKADVPAGGRVWAGVIWPPRPVESAQSQ